MNAVEKVFLEEEKDLRKRLEDLENYRQMFADTTDIDAVFANKTIYKKEEQTTITVVHFSCSGILKKALQKYFSQKFYSIALEKGDAVAVLGDGKQFSEQDVETLKKYGLYAVSQSTRPLFGNN